MEERRAAVVLSSRRPVRDGLVQLQRGHLPHPGLELVHLCDDPLHPTLLVQLLADALQCPQPRPDRHLAVRPRRHVDGGLLPNGLDVELQLPAPPPHNFVQVAARPLELLPALQHVPRPLEVHVEDLVVPAVDEAHREVLVELQLDLGRRRVGPLVVLDDVPLLVREGPPLAAHHQLRGAGGEAGGPPPVPVEQAQHRSRVVVRQARGQPALLRRHHVHRHPAGRVVHDARPRHLLLRPRHGTAPPGMPRTRVLATMRGHAEVLAGVGEPHQDRVAKMGDAPLPPTPPAPAPLPPRSSGPAARLRARRGPADRGRARRGAARPHAPPAGAPPLAPARHAPALALW